NTMTLKAGRKTWKLRFVRTYDDICEGTVGCLFGSHGFLEIAMRRRNVSRVVDVRPGSKLTIRF
ncbi:SAM-dependent chlorinase/fluorinase, partial [Candidatus Bathyarchaeota archaeon]|nr:SAM-dependent chlorinase/fluorinase [Candidatus Bathyarchaeota archaeon]